MTTWPDPARPGVPLNPERDGAHVLQFPNGTERTMLFRASPILGPLWVSSANYSFTADEVAACHAIYIGPCLTPDEVAAKAARVAELEVRLSALLECPVIAVARHHDPDSYCDETVFAETKARAALAGGKDE